MKKIFLISTLSIVLTPIFVNAQSGAFAGFVNKLVGIINLLIPFVIGLTFFAFILGIFKYSTSANNESELSKAKDVLVYGIIGIVVMLSVWGIVRLAQGTFFGVERSSGNTDTEN